jgi:hypothetical protein
MNPQRFVILLLIPFGILATAVAMLCGTILAQQGSTPDSSSLPRAQQVSPAGRGVAAAFRRNNCRAALNDRTKLYLILARKKCPTWEQLFTMLNGGCSTSQLISTRINSAPAQINSAPNRSMRERHKRRRRRGERAGVFSIWER